MQRVNVRQFVDMVTGSCVKAMLNRTLTLQIISKLLGPLQAQTRFNHQAVWRGGEDDEAIKNPILPCTPSSPCPSFVSCSPFCDAAWVRRCFALSVQTALLHIQKDNTVTRLRDYRRVLDWWSDLSDSLIQRVATIYNSLSHTHTSVHSHVFTSRCSLVASNWEQLIRTEPQHSC
jgi:hypothetical protein